VKDFLGRTAIKSKSHRARPFSSAAQNGNVFLLSAEWNADFLDELENFKGDDSVHDDQVDAASYCVLEIGSSTGEWKFALASSVGRYDSTGNFPSTGYQPMGA
jgi:hypothetical protein